MNILLTIMILWFLLIAFALCWFIYCNNRTYKQRSMMLEFINQNSDESRILTMWGQYRSVSYTEHFKCLLLFGNPWKLYKIKNHEQT